MPPLPWVSFITLLPWLGALAVWLVQRRKGHAARSLAVIVSLATLAAALALDLSHRKLALEDERTELIPWLHVEWHVGLDGVSTVALPLFAALGVFTLLGLPRGWMHPRTVVLVLVRTGCALGQVVSKDLALFALFWVLGLGALEVRTPGDGSRGRDATLSRNVHLLLGATATPLLAAVSLLGVFASNAHPSAPFDLSASASHVLPVASQWIVFSLLMLTVLVRMAVFPFHGWLPVLLERGPMAIGLLLGVTHLGLVLLVRVILPLAPDASRVAMPWVATFALAGTVYSAVLALAQRDLRRMLGFLLTSQSGLMLAGIATRNVESLAGAALESVATGVSMTGLGLLIAALEARTGSSRFEELGGLARSCPRMATLFLLLGLSAIGFPGTLAFVSEDLLLHGVLASHPLVAAVLLLATALNGITVLRAFLRVFFGPLRSTLAASPPDDLVPRERFATLTLCVFVFAMGLAPTPLLRARDQLVMGLAEPSNTLEHGVQQHLE